MNFDFDQMNKDISNAATQKGEGDNVFLKLEPGLHPVRIIPEGNPKMNLPYLRVRQHTVQVPDETGTLKTRFIMCWNYIAENIQTLGRELSDKQKLTADDFKNKYNVHGCPFCSAVKFLDRRGVDKKTVAKLLAREATTFNVLVRKDNTIKVWNVSNKIFTDLMNYFNMYKSQNLNMFDPNSGFDTTISATGTGMQRRYSVAVMGVPKPMGIPDGTPIHNLMDIAINTSFYSYQDTIDLLKQGNGLLLQANGYSIPGDTVTEFLNAANGGVNNVGITSTAPVSIAAQVSNDIFAAPSVVPVVNGTTSEIGAQPMGAEIANMLAQPVKPTMPAGAIPSADGGWFDPAVGALFDANGVKRF